MVILVHKRRLLPAKMKYPSETALLYLTREPDRSWSLVQRCGPSDPLCRQIATGFSSRREAQVWIDQASGSLTLALDLLAALDAAQDADAMAETMD